MRTTLRIHALLLISVIAATASSGCGRPLDSFDPRTLDGGVDADLDGDAQTADSGPLVSIYAEGDRTEKTFTDGLSGQTPSHYVMWINKFELLRSANDSNPALVFDHGTDYAMADMLSADASMVGQIPAADLPLGIYTHARVVLIAASVTVDDAAFHFMGTPTPGPLNIFAALSDCVIDQQSYSQNDAEYTFNSVTYDGTLPQLPTTSVGTIEQTGGETLLTVILPESLDLRAPPENDQNVTVVFEVYECFRWQELQQPDYQDGVFDFTQTSYEPVMNFGATGYRIELR